MNIEVNPFIMLEGTAREAITFYQESLGAKLLFIQTVGEGPTDQENAPYPMKIRRVSPTLYCASVTPQCS